MPYVVRTEKQKDGTVKTEKYYTSTRRKPANTTGKGVTSYHKESN